MGFVYVTEHGSTVGINGGNIIIRYKDKSEASLPKEMVEGIAIYSKSQCLQFCFENRHIVDTQSSIHDTIKMLF